MTGSEFAVIRKSFGLSCTDWGRAIGYSGTDESVATSVRRLEGKHNQHVPATVGKLAYMIDSYGMPHGWITAATAAPDRSQSEQ